MRSLAVLLLVTMSSVAAARPTTQACLGDLDAFLTCPAGAERIGNECRERGGGKRKGPTLFMRDAKRVSFAASYKDQAQSGRVFRFDAEGRLESWSDMANGEYEGLSVTCSPDGRVRSLAYYKDGRVVGLARHWRKDGSFMYAMDHDAQGRSKNITVPPVLMQRPDPLCQPARCDVDAAPALSDTCRHRDVR